MEFHDTLALQAASSSGIGQYPDACISMVSCRLVGLIQGSGVCNSVIRSHAQVLQEALLQTQSEYTEPHLLQTLGKAEEMLACLQKASAFDAVCALSSASCQ